MSDNGRNGNKFMGTIADIKTFIIRNKGLFKREGPYCLMDFIRLFLFFCLSAIVLLCLFFENTTYMCKREFALQNWMLMLMMIAALVAAAIMKRSKTDLIKIKNLDVIAKTTAIILFGVESYICYNIYFIAGWDAGRIWSMADLLSKGLPLPPQNYYSYYPNNIPITLLQSKLLEFNAAYGIFPGEKAGMAVAAVNVFINVISCYLVYLTSKRFVSQRIAFSAYIFAIILIGLSGWTVVNYSDSLTLFVPILSIYLYSYSANNSSRAINLSVKGLAILIAVLGYFVKPTCAIPVAAIIIVEVISTLKNLNKRNTIKLSALILTAAVAFVCFHSLIIKAQNKAGFDIDDNKTFGATHFLMMGLNAQRNGVYTEDDVQLSLSTSNRKERAQANLKAAGERLNDLGLKGLAKHLAKKALVVYNDGTFAWEQEGDFFAVTFEDVNTKSGSFLKKMYRSGMHSNLLFTTGQQLIWISVLLFCSISCLKKSNGNKGLDIIRLSLLGIIMYEALFEARARYLFVFVPLFIVLSAVGISRFFEIVDKLFKEVVKSNEK